MASKIAALNHYRPMIDYGKTARRREVVERIMDRTGLNEGEILLVLMELRDTLIFFNAQGYGVRLEGLGTYLPSINYEGKYTVAYRPDNDLKDALNRPGRFTGTLINRKSIGKTPEEIFARWDAEHPDDPVV